MYTFFPVRLRHHAGSICWIKLNSWMKAFELDEHNDFAHCSHHDKVLSARRACAKDRSLAKIIVNWFRERNGKVPVPRFIDFTANWSHCMYTVASTLVARCVQHWLLWLAVAVVAQMYRTHTCVSLVCYKRTETPNDRNISVDFADHTENDIQYTVSVPTFEHLRSVHRLKSASQWREVRAAVRLGWGWLDLDVSTRTWRYRI